MEESLSSFLYACLDPSSVNRYCTCRHTMQHYSYCRLSPKELLSHAYLSGVSVPAYKKVTVYWNYKTYLVILLSDEKLLL